jgi:hypothetical protein
MRKLIYNMKRARADCRLVDLEAREAMWTRKIWINVRLVMINAIVPSYHQFLGAVVGTQYSPARRRSLDIDENSRREGWNDLVALIEERHASRSSIPIDPAPNIRCDRNW